MLYMIAEHDKGKLVFLGLSIENVGEIKTDNPLMAQLSYVGFPGYLFFLCIKGGKRQERIKELLVNQPVKHFIYEAEPDKLDAFSKGLGYFKIEPSSSLPGIEQIVVFFSTDSKELIRKLRECGMATDDAVTFVPQNITDN